MENLFNKLSEILLNSIKKGEHLKLSISGEKSQFIRFSKSKVRQSGLVDDTTLTIILIKDKLTCQGSFTLVGNISFDEKNAIEELNRLREELNTLPEDPYIVLPQNTGSSHEIHKGKLLLENSVVGALSPAIQGVDLAGIWASGNIFIGNANSAGQKHWFSTDTFSFDYSLITSDERMVKGTYAGSNWNQNDYENNMSESKLKLQMMEMPGKKISPGSYRTYIAPAGVADLVSMFSWGGLSEAEIQQGGSSLCRMRQNDIQMSSCFNLSEDFTSGIVPRFNSNGELAPERLDLILSGKLTNTLVNSRTAQEYNLQSNFANEGEGLRSPFLSTGELKENEIINKIENGLYLSNLHYLNWSDRSGGRVTGMTRYACFWVENGEIIAPIENMRFDDSIYNFFGENLESVTDKAHLHPSVESYDGRELGGVTCPGILLKSFELTL